MHAVSTTETTCSNGLVGLENGEITVCCDADCGQCGGEGCGDISGLSVDDCCADIIVENGQLCSETDAAPCVLDAPGEVVVVLARERVESVWLFGAAAGGPSKNVDFPRFFLFAL